MSTRQSGCGRPARGAAVSRFFVALLVCGCATQQRVQSPGLHEGNRSVAYRLDIELYHAKNGLEILLLPDASTNLVRVDMRYRTGAGVDPPGKRGLAHLSEHVSFTLLPQGPTGPELKDLLGLVALDYNAFTTPDATHYFATGLAKDLESLIAIEAVRMRASCELVDDPRIERERQVARNELRQRTSPSQRALDVLRQEAYGPEHPYAHAGGGTEADLAAVTRDDVCAFFARHHHPGNAILVVSGKLDETEVTKLVAHYFGTLESRPASASPAIPVPALRGTRSRHELPVEEATAFIAIPGAPLGDQAVHESFLFAALTSQVSSALADNETITGVSYGRVGGPLAPLLVVAVSVQNPKQLEDVVDDIFSERDQIFNRLDEHGLTTMRNRRSAALLLASESFDDRPVLFADHQQYTSHDELIMRDFRIINEVKLEELRAHARTLLRRERSHVLYVYPNDAATFEETRPTDRLDEGNHAFEPWRKRVDPRQAEKPLSLPDVALRPELRELALENGLRVLMAPSLAYPVIDIRLVTSGGYLHEPENQTGVGYLASVLQQQSFSRPLTQDEYRDLHKLLQMGGALQSSQRPSSTVFGIAGLAAFADGFLWQLHLAMTPGRYDSAVLREVVEQQKKREDKSAKRDRDRAQVVIEAIFGADHPYATRLWQEESLGRLSTDDLEKFRDLHHRIGSTILIAAGRFDPVAFEADVRRLFGEMPARVAPPPPELPPATYRDQPTYLAMVDEAQAQTGITIAFATQRGFREQHAARLVLAEMLRERLSTSLRNEKALSYSVGVNHAQNAVGPGQLVIEAAVDPERAGEAFLLMRETLRYLREADFAADFVRARRQVVQRLLADALSSSSVANDLEFIASNQLPLDYFEHLTERVAGLRMDDVRRLILVELSPAGEVVIASGQRASMAAMYRAAAIESYRTLDRER
jgi:zinc protease